MNNILALEQNPFFNQHPIPNSNELGITPAWHDYIQDILKKRIAKNTQELQSLLEEKQPQTSGKTDPVLTVNNKKRQHKVWKTAELEYLIELSIEGKPIKEIADILNRTEEAVIWRLRSLDLRPFHYGNPVWTRADLIELESLQMGINNIKSVALKIKKSKPECLRMIKILNAPPVK